MTPEWEELNRKVIDHIQHGRFEEALLPALAALAMTRREAWEKSPALAVTLNNLGELYHALGDFEKAESAIRESIEIYEKVFGKDHPEVADGLSNLAELCLSLERYDEAEPLLQRALVIREKAQPPEHLPAHHLDIAESLNKLTMVYQATGRQELAESLMRQVIDIYSESFGEDHPAVAQAQYNLGTLLASSEKYREAAVILQLSRKVLEKSLGSQSIHLATVHETLSRVYEKLSQNEDAKEHAARAYKIRKPEHMQKPQNK